MKPISSSIMQLRTTANAPTGTQPGDHGVEAGGDVALAKSAEEIASRLVEHTPREALNVALAWVKQSGVDCSTRMSLNGPDVSIKPVEGMPPDFHSAARKAAMLLTSPPEPMIRGWLIELDTVTARKSGSEIDAAMILETYTRRLKQYPADALRFVLCEKRRKWFPELSDLEEELDAYTLPRRVLVAKLRNLARNPPARRAAPVEKWRALTPDQVEAARAECPVEQWEEFQAVGQQDGVPDEGIEQYAAFRWRAKRIMEGAAP